MEYDDFLSRQVVASKVIHTVVRAMEDMKDIPDAGKDLAFDAMFGIPDTVSSLYGADSKSVIPNNMIPLILVTQEHCATVAVDLDTVMQGDAIEKAPQVSSPEFWVALNEMMTNNDKIDLIVWAAMSRFGRPALNNLKNAMETSKGTDAMPVVIALSALSQGDDASETEAAENDTIITVCGFFTVLMLPRTLPKVVPMAVQTGDDDETPRSPTIH